MAHKPPPPGFEIGRKPEYILKAKMKGPGAYARVGVAWNNPDGSISLRLNPFVELREFDQIMVMLYPNDAKDGSKPLFVERGRCENCGGDPAAATTRCLNCDGTGVINGGNPCRACDGRGVTTTARRVHEPGCPIQDPSGVWEHCTCAPKASGEQK